MASELGNNAFSSPQLWGQMAAPLISGAAGLIGAAQQYKYNKRLMARQNRYNIDMWKMQADYNSPQSQMQRFQEAGLNPNLIYGQGSNGNMSVAPVQGVPEAPNFTPAMQKLAEAFNIENLRTIIANRKKAEADAKDAKVDAERNQQQFEGEKQFGLDYTYDLKTGRYIPVTPSDEIEVVAYPYARAYKNKLLSENYRKTYLLPITYSNIKSARDLNIGRKNFLIKQGRLLDPQIEMANYMNENKKFTYWFDRILGGLKGASHLLPLFY